MGLFSASTSPSQPSAPKPSPDGGFEAPNRKARAHCWQARDAFFGCLERNAIVDSIKDADQAQKLCGEEGKGFERDCASSWVIYFKQRRVMEYSKKKTLEKLQREGAKPMPEGTLPPGIQGRPA